MLAKQAAQRERERERESGKDQPFSMCRSVDRSILHTTPARLVLIRPVGKPLSLPPQACSRRTQVFQCHAFARAADMSLEAWCGVVLCSISFSVFSQLRVFDLDSNRPQRRQESGRMASSASSSSRAFASGFFLQRRFRAKQELKINGENEPSLVFVSVCAYSRKMTQFTVT